MLEPPNIPDSLILARLQAEYGLTPAQVTFLPIGADINTAVYRVDMPDGAPYFLKLRKGAFDPITVEVPRLLKTQDSSIAAATIAPLETSTGQLWGSLEPYMMILYPFVTGQDGYQVALTDQQWVEYGAVLRGLHDTRVPEELAMRIPRESFSPRYRDLARMYLAQAESASFSDPVAVKLAAFMRARKDTIAHMLDRCDQLGRALQSRARPNQERAFVLCHADVHPGNLHLTSDGFGSSRLYLVDWDNVIFAPKERDLMSIGAGMGSESGQGEALFYRGYNRGDNLGEHRGGQPAFIDAVALAYYRYERIIADFAAYGDQLLASTAGGPDREQSFEYFLSNFRPRSTIEVAFRTDRYWMR